MAPDQGEDKQKQEPQLPILVFGVVEVRRLKREMEALDEFMRQSAIREPGKQVALPRVSRVLDALAGDNGRNLLQQSDRQELMQFLVAIEQHAPTIHMSFASDPSSAFVAQMVTWLRTNIHPQILLQIGLQPTIAAGCVVRTPSKYFDLSLRQNLSQQRAKLVEALDSIATKETAPQAAAAPVEPPKAEVVS
jgi:F0F1-type ATP synthase delta subunit